MTQEKERSQGVVAELRSLLDKAAPAKVPESEWTWQEGTTCAACGVPLEPDMAPPGPHHCIACWDRVRVDAFKKAAKHLPDLLRVVEAVAIDAPPVRSWSEGKACAECHYCEASHVNVDPYRDQPGSGDSDESWEAWRQRAYREANEFREAIEHADYCAHVLARKLTGRAP